MPNIFDNIVIDLHEKDRLRIPQDAHEALNPKSSVRLA